jgi:hypothetical protein
MGPNSSGAKTTEKISGFRCGANLMQEFGPTVSGRMAPCRHWIGLPSAAWLWLLTYNHPESRMHLKLIQRNKQTNGNFAITPFEHDGEELKKT